MKNISERTVAKVRTKDDSQIIMLSFRVSENMRKAINEKANIEGIAVGRVIKNAINEHLEL